VVRPGPHGRIVGVAGMKWQSEVGGRLQSDASEVVERKKDRRESVKGGWRGTCGIGRGKSGRKAGRKRSKSGMRAGGKRVWSGVESGESG